MISECSPQSLHRTFLCFSLYWWQIFKQNAQIRIQKRCQLRYQMLGSLVGWFRNCWVWYSGNYLSKVIYSICQDNIFAITGIDNNYRHRIFSTLLYNYFNMLSFDLFELILLFAWYTYIIRVIYAVISPTVFLGYRISIPSLRNCSEVAQQIENGTSCQGMQFCTALQINTGGMCSLFV